MQRLPTREMGLFYNISSYLTRGKDGYDWYGYDINGFDKNGYNEFGFEKG